ncbi:centrosome and spindle pole-associated protein 1-like isoform X3 [Anneissia japonica]|uniref:centrosome and spindle pole-associated protein 1-like isoform X3 n=1 Tax=Anneissia japonica TaxID=1529436 RepID=UPI0014255F78|nr:centrosome and spindle pole-associated protein 1-like isoform X3 [Anneissia japonica]
MTEDELEVFIAEQKARIAKERQQLQSKSLDKSQDLRRDGLGASSSKENIPPHHSKKEPPAHSDKQGDAVTNDQGRALPRGSYANLREKLNAERREEYNKFLAQKKMRSGPQKVQPKVENREVNGTNSLSIAERNSAKLQARRERNKEYNDFLKQKGQVQRGRHRGQSESDEQKIPNVNGVDRESPRDSSFHKEQSGRGIGGSYDNKRSPRPRHADHHDNFQQTDFSSQTLSPRRDYSRHYDDGPPPARKGWGTPVHLDYDDILRRKRAEEARYRRYDDDLDYYERRGMRPSVSDPYLNWPGPDNRRHYNDRYEDERDYDSRRVRFDDYRDRERGRYNRRDDMYDGTDQNFYREERSRTLPEMESKQQKAHDKPEVVNTRKPRPKSADDEGFFIGQRQSLSASQRKKEEYRKELEKQMKEAQEAKRRNREMEKSEGLTVSVTGLQDPEKLPDRLKALPKPVSRQAPSQAYHAAPSAGMNYTSRYQPSFAPQVNQAYMPPQPVDIPDFGLESAIQKPKAPMLEKPFELGPYHLPNYKSDSVDPYMYYGMRNPMEGEPGSIYGFTGQHFGVVSQPGDNPKDILRKIEINEVLQEAHSSGVQQINPSSRSAYEIFKDFLGKKAQEDLPHNGVVPHYNGYNGYAGPSRFDAGHNDPSLKADSSSKSYPILDPRPTQPLQKTGQSSIHNFVGDSSKSPRNKDNFKSYQEELRIQIQEKEKRKREEKLAQERYDLKMEEEAKHYQPFGKGGGGAPMRDNKGHIIADLKQVKQMKAFEGLSNDVFGGPASNLNASGEVGQLGLSPRANIPAIQNPAEFGTSLDAPPTNAKDEYKESLKKQIEEKKRRQEEEKEQERLREEKQERQLREQREKMQREFEAEKEKQRQKEEKARQENEELSRRAEERRKEEKVRANVENTSVEQHNRAAEVRRESQLPRNDSPPIPTLRKKQEEHQLRNDSPPVPTLRKKQEENQFSQPKTDSPVVPSLSKMLKDNKKQKKTPIEESESPRDSDVSPIRPGNPPRDSDERPIKPGNEDMYFHADSKNAQIEDAVVVDMSFGQSSLIADNYNGRTSPPVPAVSTKERAGENERDVMSALSTMRKQLQSEQRRVQQALEREYDPYTHVPSTHTSRRTSPQVNVLDLEKKKMKPVTVRRELTNQAAAYDFNSLKDRGSHSRQKVREQYPNEPTTDIALEAQQRALLKQQQEKLDSMRKAYQPSKYDMASLDLHHIGRGHDSPLIPLESSSAFIGIDSGESKIPADERSLPGSARTRDLYGDIASINEDALDILERKNKERIAALAAIESDGVSNEDPDDVLQKFMLKTSRPRHRPPSGKSEDLSLWLQPTGY